MVAVGIAMVEVVEGKEGLAFQLGGLVKVIGGFGFVYRTMTMKDATRCKMMEVAPEVLLVEGCGGWVLARFQIGNRCD